jgi:hypothetical protein
MFFNLGLPPKGPPPPFSAWQTRHIKVVERAIAMAWTQAMNTTHGVALLASGKETEITAMLQDTLTALLGSGLIHGFSPAIFGAPIRGQELEDYSGRYLEKRPDLTFPRLSARPTINHNALFYECKLLGRGRTVDDYITEGVARFQNGHYAWAMQHAGMIGYVVDKGQANACEILSKRWKHPSKPTSCVPIRPVEEDQSTTPRITISIHARSFILRNGIPPGDIVLRHMWLDPV